MNAVKFAERLREVADAIESLGDDHKESMWVTIHASEPATFKLLAAAFVPFVKEPDDYYFRIANKDGASRISMNIERSKVCRKVKVMKEVDAYECDDSLLDPTPEVADHAAENTGVQQ